MKNTKKIVRAGVIAGLYTALTYACMSFAYGPVQIRIGEALTILPLFYPETVIALGIGCFLSDIGSPYGVIDMVLGSLTTFLAAFLTYFCGKKLKNKYVRFLVGGLPPVLLNAFLLPLVWLISGAEEAYFPSVLSVIVTQAIFVYGAGFPLYTLIEKLRKKGIKSFLD